MIDNSGRNDTHCYHRGDLARGESAKGEMGRGEMGEGESGRQPHGDVYERTCTLTAAYSDDTTQKFSSGFKSRLLSSVLDRSLADVV